MVGLSFADAAAAAIGAVRLERRPIMRAPRRSGAPHPTGAKIRRGSIEAGTFEDGFFQVPAKGETDTILRSARRLVDAGRQLRRDARAEGRTLSKFEQLIAALNANVVRVFEELLTLARLNQGRVFPTYDHLADSTGLGRATIARALPILEAIGFIAKQRRFKRVAGDGPGPRYEQTSNVYRAFLPKSIMRFLPRWMRPAPLPADEIQREADRVEAVETMLAGLSCREYAQATVGGELGRLLARLGAAIDESTRESQTDTQPLLDSYIIDANGVGLVGQRPNA